MFEVCIFSKFFLVGLNSFMLSAFASENKVCNRLVIMASVVMISTVLISVSEALLLLNSRGVPTLDGEATKLNSDELNFKSFLELERGLRVVALGEGRVSFSRLILSMGMEVFAKILAY